MRKYTEFAAFAIFGIWAATALPSAGQEWIRASLDYNPNARLIDYLLANADSTSVVVFSEQWLYRDLYPYLHRQTNLVLVVLDPEDKVASSTGTGNPDPQRKTAVSQQLNQLSERYREIFDVRHIEDLQGKQLEQMLASKNQLMVARRIRDLSVSRWSTPP